MQVGANAKVVQLFGLAGTTAGDDRHRWAVGLHHLQLLGPQLGRDEAQNANTPRQFAQTIGGLCQQAFHLGSAQQGQRQEGQPAAPGHGLGESRGVRHPGHRALEHRVGGSRALGQRPARAKRCGGGGGRHVGVHRSPDRLHGTGHRHPDGGQPAGHRQVLTRRYHLRLRIVEAEVECVGK